MTVLMTDAQSILSQEAQLAVSNNSLEDVLFADDTLLISTSAKHLQEYMAAVEQCGRQYGLEIHWGKVHYVPVSSEQCVKSPAGETIQPKESMIYLGATIHGDGRFGSEVSRKIGAAKEAFKFLHAIWKHSRITKHRKVQLFEALILSKLRYATASAWLLKAELRRLDGFQAHCLRQILNVRARMCPESATSASWSDATPSNCLIRYRQSSNDYAKRSCPAQRSSPCARRLSSMTQRCH